MPANVRLYRLFTIGFNARFYYPILAILFLDLGLTLSQFVTLNAIWAATIFLAEVPSGALADIIGRKKLLVTAAVLMVFEMLVILFAPRDAGLLLFALCAVNRVLSGLAEAAASGADQALAYDTLEEHGRADEWDEVLASVMRWQSIAMVVALVVGSLCYDPRSINWLLQLIGADLRVDQAFTLRIPIALCAAQAIFTLAIALRFRDVDEPDSSATIGSVFRQTLAAAKWVITTRVALLIVIGGVVIDALARNFATINSQYFRAIEIPELLFGAIAALTAMLGIVLPSLYKYLARTYSPLLNFSLAALVLLASLFALIPSWKWWGAIPAATVMAALGYISFLVSRYLNQLSSRQQRATVLSVKGLLFNVGYGVASIGFAALVSRGEATGEDGFLYALTIQPWIFAVAFATFAIVASVQKLNSRYREAT